MTIGMTSSVQGMDRAISQFNQAADNIAQWPSSNTSTSAPHGDTVDLSAQAVALLESKNSFEANTAALKIGDEMTQSLLKSIS